MTSTKKLFCLVLLFMVSIAMNTQAKVQETNQSNLTTSEKFFVGKWKLEVKGLPSGDTTMYLILEKKDGKLGGTIGEEKDGIKLDDAKINDQTLNISFIGEGYDVPMKLKKNGENSVTGDMFNNMFDVTGTKISQ